MVDYMFDLLLELTKDIKVSDVIIIVAVCGWLGTKAYTYLKAFLDQHRNQVELDISQRESYQHLVDELGDTKEQLDHAEEGLENKVSRLFDIIEDLKSETADPNSEHQKTIAAMVESIERQDETIKELTERVIKIEEQIELLFRADKEYVKAHIVEGHNRYVQDEKTIDLLTLQNLESIYNKYLEEGGGEDEFLAKLMKELRDLPTTKKRRTPD